MTHLEAQNRIKGCHDHLTLSVSRYAQGRLSQNEGASPGRANSGSPAPWESRASHSLSTSVPWHPRPKEQRSHRGLAGTVWRCGWLKKGRSPHLIYCWSLCWGLLAGGRQPKIRAEIRPGAASHRGCRWCVISVLSPPMSDEQFKKFYRPTPCLTVKPI